MATLYSTSETDFEEPSNRRLAAGQTHSQQQAQEKVNGTRKRNNEEINEDLNGGAVAAINEREEDQEEVEEEEEEEVELMMIDFEYCSYNYRGFDLANHFLEWTFDYTNKDYPFFFHKKQQFPNAAQKRAFLDTYLKRSREIKGGGGGGGAAAGDLTVEQAERDLLEREIDFFKCASHLFWSLWAIVYSDQVRGDQLTAMSVLFN